MPINKHPWKTVANKRQGSLNSVLLNHIQKQIKITNYWLGDTEASSTNRLAAHVTDDPTPQVEEIIPRPPIML